MARGQLRIYLGAAPGVGKTVAMLDEAHRRVERGTDLVVGYIETHDRPYTHALVEGLEVLPRRVFEHRGSQLLELDTEALIARRPQVALVDELAHTNAPGSKHDKRWQDVEDLLEAGIDVLSTVNIQHLESLNDVARAITGVRQRETVPDQVVRRAEQIELVDMTPEALRRRMAHGNVYRAEKVDAALANYFRVGNLAALREIALLWLADRVDEAMERYRAAQGIDRQWPTRERVVVALTGGGESETLLRRGARIATRSAGGDLIACHVRSADGLAVDDPAAIERLRRLTTDLGGEFHDVSGHDVASAILDHARGANATQIVVGVSRRSRWQAVLRPSIASEVADRSGDIDVHLVSHENSRVGRRSRRVGALPRSRVLAGWGLATLGLGLLTALLIGSNEPEALSLDLLLYLALTVACALVGGIWPALFCAVAGSVAVNWFFTDPVGTLSISDPPNALALLVFVLVAMGVSSVVNVAARRAEQAQAAQRESSALASLSRDLLAQPKPLPVLLDKATAALGMRSAVIATPSPGGLTIVASNQPGTEVGDLLPAGQDWAVDTALDDGAHLLLDGPPVAAENQRLVGAYAAHALILLAREEQSRAAKEAAGLARDNAARTTLLAAVSHDLRTPLSSIKAGVSMLRQTSVSLPESDRAELLESVEDSADRLDALIGNLLDLSRLETGMVKPHAHEIDLLDAVHATVRTTTAPARVDVALDHDLPAVVADLGLLDRVVANVVENALRHSAGADVRITASRIIDTVQLRVSDQGPGVDDADKERIFAAFQRAGDAPQGDGLGLGLAVARGLMTVMGGTLVPEDTPGGGLTMVMELPVADASLR
ncbi:histidine kinase [Humibacillus sp. DSM 29435]|uniref:DUF4118 domain-containing protein n=1 Tax=Humibacillus sp. DSM 29435 TaxID=1869167 RepID=UPI000871DB3F|nr:DUF4118 domain-containing protein [Humibacillus sp. DSM 29435]OFE16547.1 histidine kinase [Humibacillus sp. DSM 29435]